MLSACDDSPCGNKQCIAKYKLCDGIPDCSDAGDEKDCYGELLGPTHVTYKPVVLTLSADRSHTYELFWSKRSAH